MPVPGKNVDSRNNGQRNDPSPPHLVADEKHTKRGKEKEFIAVTAASGCILGASCSQNADGEGLKKAYGVFAQEAQTHDSDYQPLTVTTDGWEATRSAWSQLFPGICLILCFLHEVLKIRDICRSKGSLLKQIEDKLWNTYHGASKRQFAQRLRRLLQWARAASLPERLMQKLRRIRDKSHLFQKAFDFPKAYRTSNQVDRPMNYLERLLYTMQYFHGRTEAAELSVRSLALLWNFHPYCRKTRTLKAGVLSPFEELNGFRYHDNWFKNLMIASSLNGRRPRIQT